MSSVVTSPPEVLQENKSAETEKELLVKTFTNFLRISTSKSSFRFRSLRLAGGGDADDDDDGLGGARIMPVYTVRYATKVYVSRTVGAYHGQYVDDV